jgi:hypothetical protein
MPSLRETEHSFETASDRSSWLGGALGGGPLVAPACPQEESASFRARVALLVRGERVTGSGQTPASGRRGRASRSTIAEHERAVRAPSATGRPANSRPDSR